MLPLRDRAPDEPSLTDYDLAQAKRYLRLLDAAAEDADWREVARIVLEIDPIDEPARARTMWETHLARAQWMTREGWKQLLAMDKDGHQYREWRNN